MIRVIWILVIRRYDNLRTVLVVARKRGKDPTKILKGVPKAPRRGLSLLNSGVLPRRAHKMILALGTVVFGG